MVDATETVSVPLERVEALLAENDEALRSSLTSSTMMNDSQIALAQLIGANAHGQMLESLRQNSVESLDLPLDVAGGTAGAMPTYSATMFAGEVEMERNGIDRPDLQQIESATMSQPNSDLEFPSTGDGVLIAGAGGLRGNSVVDAPSPSAGWNDDAQYEVHLLSNIAGGPAGAIFGGQQHGFIVVTEAGKDPDPQNALLVMRGGPYPYGAPGFEDESRKGELYVDDTTTSRFDLSARNITDHGSVPIIDSLSDIRDRMNTVRNDINPDNGSDPYPYSGGALLSPFNVGGNSNTVARLVFQEAIEYNGGNTPAIEPVARMTGWNINLSLPNAQHDYDYEGRYSNLDNAEDQSMIAGDSKANQHLDENIYHDRQEDHDYGIV